MAATGIIAKVACETVLVLRETLEKRQADWEKRFGQRRLVTEQAAQPVVPAGVSRQRVYRRRICHLPGPNAGR